MSEVPKVIKESWAVIETMHRNTQAFRIQLSKDLSVAYSRADEARGEGRDEKLLSTLLKSIETNNRRKIELDTAMKAVGTYLL